MKFCANDKCICHVEVPWGFETFTMFINGQKKNFKQSKHLTRNGKTIYFCDSCIGVFETLKKYN